MNAADIRGLVVAALKNNTDAGDRVYSPRDWPTMDEDFPVLLVQTPLDVKHSLGRNAPQFTTVTTVRITCRTQAFDTEEGNTGAQQSEIALETLREQIERSIINSYELTRQIQQYQQVRSAVAVSSEGSGHIGELTVEIDVEYYQGPEDFYPVTTAPLAGIDLAVKMPDGTTQPGMIINLQE